LRVVAPAHFYITRVLAKGSGCTVAHIVSRVFMAAAASLLTGLYQLKSRAGYLQSVQN